MKKPLLNIASSLVFTMLSLASGAAFAQSSDAPMQGMAKPWELNLQAPATPVMERLENMHNFLLYLIIAISLFVLAVLIYICLRFNRRANPVPSKTTHNTKLEIIWTTIPILILIAIAIPSLRLHYFMQRAVDPEMTLKVVGYQWYWHYDYPDQGGFGFDSYLKKGNDLQEGDIRMLAVDNRVVVPVDTTVRVLVTGADVIHSWAVPAFGVKRDGVPGRLNETWFKADHLGTFYGQCSELCGVGHGFMPIVVDVVSKEDFQSWAAKKRADAGIILPDDKTAGKAPIAPLAKASSMAKNKTPDAEQAEEKERSQKTGEGKPSKAAPGVTPPEKGTRSEGTKDIDPTAKSSSKATPSKADEKAKPETQSEEN